jgi:hypothetical protein
MLGVTFFGLFLTPVRSRLRSLSGIRPLKQNAEKPPTLVETVHPQSACWAANMLTG